MPIFSLAPDGRLLCEGHPFLPMGFNYWPPESGVECWTEACWSIEPFRRDFHAMAERGFNCVRMFLRWPEFQPDPETVNPTSLARLAEVGHAAREAGIYLIPTLFVGFMSGGVYPPPWLGERNLFTDPACIRAAALLATEAGRALAPTDSVLAYDFSNEINVWCTHLPPLTTEEAIAWQRQIITALRAGHPGALLINGTDHQGIVAEGPWNLRAQCRVPTDLLSIHVYPVRYWNPLQMASLQAYEADILAPVHVAMARTYGPVMLEEFGVAVPVSGRHPRHYLFQAVVGCWLAGSNGFLLWGWQDFATCAGPYRENPMEKEICFLDGKGEVKEMGHGYLDAVAWIRAQEADGFSSTPTEIGVFLGDAYWEGPFATRQNSIRCFWLSATLRRLHLAHTFTETIDAHYKVIIVPGPRLNLDEIAALHAFVAQGGRVLLADVGFSYWCDDLKALADLDLVDMAHLAGEVEVRGEETALRVPGLPYFPVAAPRQGRVLATMGEEAYPAMLVSGDNRVVTLFLPVDQSLCDHPARLEYHRLLTPIFATWGLYPEAEGLTPDIECRLLVNAGGAYRLALLNHASHPFAGTVYWRGNAVQVEIPAKGAVAITVAVPVER